MRCSGTSWADKLTPNRGPRTDRKSTETALCAGTRFCRFSVGPRCRIWGCGGDLGIILRCSGTSWADKLTPNRGPRTDRKSTETALCAGTRFCRFSVGPRGLIWGCGGDFGGILRCLGTSWEDKLTSLCKFPFNFALQIPLDDSFLRFRPNFPLGVHFSLSFPNFFQR